MMLECPEGGTPEHRAWLDALSDDERTVVYAPVGRLHELLVIAYTKYAIERVKMPRGERAMLLQQLNDLVAKLPHGFLSAEMLATIQPMSDTEVQMMHEARSLDPKDCKSGKASFDVLTNLRTFSIFVTLNPSLLTALKMRWPVPRWQEEVLK
jgi:hypothetical protein